MLSVSYGMHADSTACILRYEDPQIAPPILGLTSAIKGLILSGGLAQQEYLKDQLLVKLRQKIDQNLEIIPEIPQDSYVPYLLCDAI
jgi:hypothetical protein